MLPTEHFEKQEFNKRDKELCLIASENYPSEQILNASGSIFQCKYSEGFPDSQRYYEGCEIVDIMEQQCIDTCLMLFKAQQGYLANVQPNSGASANMIVYNAILQPNDTVLSMDVKAGSHISHGHPKSFLAKYHNVVTYGVDDNGLLDYDNIEKIALECKPKLIICGASNYPRYINFERFKQIADKVGAYLMADIAHISALVAHNLHPSPVGYADFITFTTHKCLAGPRGGVIIYKKEFDKQIKLSTIPSLFGGPLEHQIYAKLVCFWEQTESEKKEVANKIIKYAKIMANIFKESNIPIVTGDTDNHLMTIDLTNFNISGKELSTILSECGVITNCNTVPNDKRSFLETSGVRIGVPAVVTRGLDEVDITNLSKKIARLITCFRNEISTDAVNKAKQILTDEVNYITSKYPLSNIYPETAKRMEAIQWE